jgi:hypothetical protein
MAGFLFRILYEELRGRGKKQAFTSVLLFIFLLDEAGLNKTEDCAIQKDTQ